LWLVANGNLAPFDDDLDGYAKWLSEQRDGTRQSGNDSGGDNADNRQQRAADRKAQKQADAERRKQLTPLKKAVDKQSGVVDALSEELVELRNRLGANDLYTEDRKAELTELLQAESTLAASLASAEDELLLQMEALEAAEQGTGS